MRERERETETETEREREIGYVCVLCDDLKVSEWCVCTSVKEIYLPGYMLNGREWSEMPKVALNAGTAEWNEITLAFNLFKLRRD